MRNPKNNKRKVLNSLLAVSLLLICNQSARFENPSERLTKVLEINLKTLETQLESKEVRKADEIKEMLILVERVRLQSELNTQLNTQESIIERGFDELERYRTNVSSESNKKKSQNYIPYLVVFALFFSSISLLILFSSIYKKRHSNNNEYDFVLVIQNKIIPEEYIANLNTMIERWQKQKLSNEEIEFRILRCKLNLIVISLNCKIQNIWLDRNRID